MTRWFGVAGLCGTVVVLGGLFHWPWLSTTYVVTPAAETVLQEPELADAAVRPSPSVTAKDERPRVRHVPRPESVKALYMTSCVVGTPAFRDRLVDIVETTELNSIVIDIKDYSGAISFPPENPAWQPAWRHARCGAPDLPAFIDSLHDRGIYVIGRITVFQDPFEASRSPHLAVTRADGVTVWRDHKGLSFIDVAATPYWDHLIALAVDSYRIGFDELNFDYVRYPSDGDLRDIAFPHTARSQWPGDKAANLENFFSYLHAAMTDPDRFAAVIHDQTGRATATPWTSVDLFGMTTTNTDDLAIGQVLERAAPYFDVVAPMVYPSHYPRGYRGYDNPNDVPGEIVFHAMASAVARLASPTTTVPGFLHTRVGTTTPPVYQKPVFSADHLRTWIQDFDYGGDYDAADVRAQIEASRAAGVSSFMIWSPSNSYTLDALEQVP
jgi:hypothetical protein